MKVVDSVPHLCFLLHEEKNYFLLVRCQQSFAEYELLIELSADEWKEYHALGHVYIEYLAARVSYWAREYFDRNLLKQWGEAANRAIDEWKTSQHKAL